MRQFELAPGGHTPRHTHAHEHEVFVLEGAGVVRRRATASTRSGRAPPFLLPPTSFINSATRAPAR